MVLVDVHEVKDLWLAGGGAGDEAFAPFTHQPLVGLSVHVTGHMLRDPSIHPGLETFVQPRADPLVGLENNMKNHNDELALPLLVTNSNNTL